MPGRVYVSGYVRVEGEEKKRTKRKRKKRKHLQRKQSEEWKYPAERSLG